jgi:hypothetical protein
MKKKKAFIFSLVISGSLILSVLFLDVFGCGSSGGDSNTVTGSITGGTHPVVGLFNDTYWFVNNPAGETDVVDIQLNMESEPYTPITYGTINGVSYSLTLPSVSPGIFYLIVWDDTDQDGLFSGPVGPEPGYFPMKSFDTGTYAVNALSYIEIMGQGEWAANYYDGSTNYVEGFSIVGSDEYNFTID